MIEEYIYKGMVAVAALGKQVDVSQATKIIFGRSRWAKFEEKRNDSALYKTLTLREAAKKVLFFQWPGH